MKEIIHKEATKKTAIPANKVKKLNVRVCVAMKYGFFLEAVWLLSKVFEKKLEKINELLGMTEVQKNTSFSILLKTTRAVVSASSDPILIKRLQPSLIEQIRQWRMKRNKILLEMKDNSVTEVRISRLANEGIQLYKELSRASKLLKFRKNDLSIQPEKDPGNSRKKKT